MYLVSSIYIYIYPPAPGTSSTAACCCPRWRWCRPWRPAGCGSRTSSSAAGSLRPRRRRLKHQDCSCGYLAVTVALSSLVLIMIAVRSTCSGPLSDGPLLPYLTLHASQLLCSSILKSFVTIIVFKKSSISMQCIVHCTLYSSHHFAQTYSMFTCQMFGGEREAVLGCVVRRRRRLHILLQQLVNLLIQKLLVGAGNSALQLRFVIDLENKSIKMSRALKISIYYLPESPVHMRVS